jgi:hypothetical protein
MGATGDRRHRDHRQRDVVRRSAGRHHRRGAHRDHSPGRCRAAARARLSREDAHRRLAERGTTAQADAAGDLRRVTDDLSAVRARLDSIERMMREIE